jgi:putative endonuclease
MPARTSLSVVVGTFGGVGRERKLLGDYGESRARRVYERAGYDVLAQNWRGRAGEIDLVLARDGCVVICEVKTRATERFGLPSEAVDWRKQRRLRALAYEFLAATRPACKRVRFDVVAIVSGRLEIIEDAF